METDDRAPRTATERCGTLFGAGTTQSQVLPPPAGADARSSLRCDGPGYVSMSWRSPSDSAPGTRPSLPVRLTRSSSGRFSLAFVPGQPE
jgi:hypothetical protein